MLRPAVTLAVRRLQACNLYTWVEDTQHMADGLHAAFWNSADRASEDTTPAARAPVQCCLLEDVNGPQTDHAQKNQLACQH